MVTQCQGKGEDHDRNGDKRNDCPGEGKEITDQGVRSRDTSQSSLFEAARIGDTASVQSAIMRGVDVNAKDGAGERYHLTTAVDQLNCLESCATRSSS